MKGFPYAYDYKQHVLDSGIKTLLYHIISNMCYILTIRITTTLLKEDVRRLAQRSNHFLKVGNEYDV